MVNKKRNRAARAPVFFTIGEVLSTPYEGARELRRKPDSLFSSYL